jgi:hypothetical protein
LEIRNLDGSVRVSSLPWSSLSYTSVLNGPGSCEFDVSLAKVTRAQIEPGKSDYRIYEDGTLRAAGRIWSARANTVFTDGSYRATIVGEGVGGIFSRRTVDWGIEYVRVTESPAAPDTTYGLSQEEILWDMVLRSQSEPYGDLSVTQGAHTGTTPVLRHRLYCEADGTYISEVFEDFAGLGNDRGLDWAITPTLTDSSVYELVTWCPKRGSDLSGSVSLDGTAFLDTLNFTVDAGQVVSRGHSVAEGKCGPFLSDQSDAGALAEYGLLEAFESANGDDVEDADDTAQALISPKALVGADIEYELSAGGPAIGSFDCGDIVNVTSSRPDWGFDVPALVQEIQVSIQLPDNDEMTFVRVNITEVP